MAFRKSGFSSRKSSYAKRSGAARSAKVAQARKVNRPVRRALSRRVTPVTTNTKNNKSAIMTLSKQVRTLQMLRYGEMQFQHQHIGTTTGKVVVYPGQIAPVAFCVNDLYNGSKIWTGGMTSGAPVLTESATWAKATVDLDTNSEYDWNIKQAHDNVNAGHFMPVSTSIKFFITNKFDTQPTETYTVRFHIFKIKNANTNGSVKVGMPHNLGAYWHMVDDNPVHRNHFNTHEHHILLQTKTVSFTPTDFSRAMMSKSCTVKMNFKPKELTPEITETDPSGQTFASNVPTKDQIWCLISTNSSAGHFSITGERWNKWRDHTGTAS